jgi:hypothetical protein
MNWFNYAILHLNLHREYFAAIAAKTKRTEYRRRTPDWKTRLENRKYDAISFRNGYATDALEKGIRDGVRGGLWHFESTLR